MKFRFALLVGLLLATSIGAQTSTDDPPTTPSASSGTPQASDSPSSSSTAPDVTSPATDASPPATEASSPATGASDATTVSVDPSATTPSAGPSDAPMSTVSGATAGPTSSDSPVVTTPGGPTPSQGPTTTAPLPNVTYSLVQFGSPVCVDLTCTYEINAPVNNQAVLATEQSIISADRDQFGGLQASASSVDSQVKTANDQAQNKINELQNLLNQIQANLNFIQNATKNIQSQQDTALTSLILVEKFISDVNKDPSICLYKCLRPTTPAPPTTPTTPAPTTPPSPCANYTCPGDPTGATHCKLDTTNLPFCDNCEGNYDAYNHCATIACSATGNPIKANTTNSIFPWYSTGYNATGGSTIPANANCVWNLPSGPLNVSSKDDFNFDCLKNNSVTITFTNPDGVTQDVSSTTSLRVLNPLLGRMENGTITLKSTGEEPSFCFINLQKAPSPGMMEEEVPKRNGFFSWLMGN